MTDRPADFRVLDPATDPARMDRLAQAISARIAPSLGARRAPRTMWTELAGWRRPVLAAAAVLLAVSVVIVLRVAPVGGRTASAREGAGLLEAAGAPTSIAGWTEARSLPDPASVLGIAGR